MILCAATMTLNKFFLLHLTIFPAFNFVQMCPVTNMQDSASEGKRVSQRTDRSLGSPGKRTGLADESWEVPPGSDCSLWTPPPDITGTLRLPHTPSDGYSKVQSVLGRVVEKQIIPRLLLANSSAAAAHKDVDGPAVSRLHQIVDEFAELAIERDAASCLNFFQALRDEGFALEVLFQDLLAPTARRLGELWDEDINDFLDVTRGVSHLQQIVQVFSAEFGQTCVEPITNRRALFMPLPGEQHMFGISLIGEHFRREGWRVWSGPPNSIDEILELVSTTWFDVIGLSASAVHDAGLLAHHIRRIRDASRNNRIVIFVGGHAFLNNPELTSSVGADATASDGQQALLKVQDVLAPLPKLV
jgi:MerR family transcriptional regulator, light-induced transcriptional regulator